MNGKGNARRRHQCMLLLALLFFVLCAARVWLALEDDGPSLGGGPLNWRGIVLSAPESRGKVWRFDALVTDAGGKAAKPFKAKVTFYPGNNPVSLGIGEGIKGKSQFEEYRFDASDSASYRRYLLSQGFRAQTFVVGKNLVGAEMAESDIPPLTRFQTRLLAFRQRLSASYASHGISGDNLAVVTAMTLGDRTQLHGELRDAYSVSGASHVLALSGLHLGIIYSLLTMLMWRRNRLWKFRLAASFVVILTVWGYVSLVGMPVSAVRSAVMLTVCSVVRAVSRRSRSLRPLLLAAMAIVATSPLSVFDIGFQMSFLSVAAIHQFASPLYAVLVPCRLRWIAPLRWIGSLTAVSLSAQIGVAPLTAYCFSRFSCYFLLTNIIAIPLATLLLYLSLAFVFSAFVPPLQSLLGLAINYTAGVLNGSLRYISSLPDASIEGIHLSFVQVLLIYAFCLLVYQLLRLLKRSRIYRIRYGKYPPHGLTCK